MIKRIGRWFDDRLGASKFARTSLNKVFPDHWSFMLGEVAMYCFVVLVLPGVYLTFFFVPSDKTVIYHGSYVPLRGVAMSQAYESTVRLSFDVRAGLVMRQIHHWAALVFIATIVAHLCRIFFTGAFRRPRELNWIIGVTLLLLAIFNGFAGYSLPDDLLSGTGLRIAYSIALAIPIVGTWLAFLVFGGEFPASDILTRLYVIHILLIPVAIATLLGAHLAVLWRQKHTQFRGRGRREDNVVGSRLWPTYTAKSIGLFAVIAGVLALLGGLAQINPVWLYGPFDPSAVSTAAQPDWYLGWIEGALRLAPPVYLHIGPYNVSELFWPAIALPGITFMLLYLWPFLERRVTHDDAEHNLLDRPSDRPMRTARCRCARALLVLLLGRAGHLGTEAGCEPLACCGRSASCCSRCRC
jgi:ubiquinol-cytochrome c reductase cytochrome b subunit